MRIGTARRNPETGRYPFLVNIPFLDPCEIELKKTESTHEKAPSMDVLYRGEKCGALWKREARGASGESFLAGNIESPVFPGGRLEIAVWHSKEVAGDLDMTWRPAQERPAPQTESRPSQAGGISTPSDDDIPF